MGGGATQSRRRFPDSAQRTQEIKPLTVGPFVPFCFLMLIEDAAILPRRVFGQNITRLPFPLKIPLAKCTCARHKWLCSRLSSVVCRRVFSIKGAAKSWARSWAFDVSAPRPLSLLIFCIKILTNLFSSRAAGVGVGVGVVARSVAEVATF